MFKKSDLFSVLAALYRFDVVIKSRFTRQLVCWVVVWNDRPVTGRLMLGVVLLKDKPRAWL